MVSEEVFAFLDQFDLTVPYVIVGVLASFTTVWVMQCLTPHSAVIGCARARRLMLFRVALMLMAATMMVVAVAPIITDTEPSAEVLALLCAVEVLLITLPLATGGRTGIDYLLYRDGGDDDQDDHSRGGHHRRTTVIDGDTRREIVRAARPGDMGL